MRRKFLFRRSNWILVTAVILATGMPGTIARADDSILQLPPNSLKASGGEFDGVADAVVALLQSKDASQFARSLAIAPSDWTSLVTPKTSTVEAGNLANFAKGAENNLAQITASGQAVLDKAKALHLDFSRDRVHAKVIMPLTMGQVYLSSPAAGGTGLPYVQDLEVVLIPDSNADGATNRNFSVGLRGMEKFPGGWHCSQGIQWTAFPANMVDEKTAREMAILKKVANGEGFDGTNDPALLTLGEGFVKLVRDHDTSAYAKDLLVNSDLVWATYQKSGHAGPTRAQVDADMAKRNADQVAAANAMVKMMEDAGMDLKNADIKITAATVDHAQATGPAGSIENLLATQYRLMLTVKTDGKAKSGASLAGDYVLAAKALMRFGESWRVMDDVRWEKVPAGIVDADTAAKMELENYVAVHRSLPVAYAAPEINFTNLADGATMKLSDLRGKVVILDFWATWCGPCQAPMADLQKLKQMHEGWGDKVTIVPLSIDDTIDALRRHVEARGWTNTFNVWAGDGGWHSAPVKSFRVSGVPTTYIIDQQGKIAWAGNSLSASLDDTINELLSKN